MGIAGEKKQLQLFTQLISLISSGYVFMYIAGYLYEKAYFNSFFIDADHFDASLTYYLSVCLQEVILHSVVTFSITVCLLAGLTVVFYAAIDFEKIWLGYTLLCSLLLVVFGLSVFSGLGRGKQDARRDWHTNSTALPTVAFSFDDPMKFDPRIIQLGERSSARLLHESNNYFYILETRDNGDESDLPVHLLPKESVSYLSIYRLNP